MFPPLRIIPQLSNWNWSWSCNWCKANYMSADIQKCQECLNNLFMIEESDWYLNCIDPHCTNVLHRKFIEVCCKKYDECEKAQLNKETIIGVNSVKHFGNIINNDLSDIDY